MPFVHFPINLKSGLPEKVVIRQNDTAEQSWGCLLKFTSGHRGSLQPDSSSPPSFSTSLPPFFFSSVASQLLPRHSLTHASALPLPLCIFHLSQWAVNVSSSSSSLDCQGGTVVYDSKTITTLIRIYATEMLHSTPPAGRGACLEVMIWAVDKLGRAENKMLFILLTLYAGSVTYWNVCE